MAEDKEAAKQRIFKAAASLFAQKGYAAVSVREITKKAKVNIAMLNYYFGGKIGILKAIISDCYEKYYNAVEVVGDEDMPPEERIRAAIRNIIDFYRDNRELAMVAFNTIPVDIPEILDHKLKWVAARHREAVDFFCKLGVDMEDMVTASVIRGMLTTLIADHFQFRYVWEHILRSPAQAQFVKKHNMKVAMLQFDDTYYRKYGEVLSAFYLHGLRGVAKKQQDKKNTEVRK